MPDGADRVNVRNQWKFRETARRHAFSWYQHANVRFGRMASNGSLYLLTGCDKAISWGMASFSCASEECDISLKFTAAQVAEVGAAYVYSWETYVPATVRVGPYRDGGGQERLKNQSVFLRGFKISIREGAMGKLMGPVKLKYLERSKLNEISPREGGYIPYISGGKSPSRSTGAEGSGSNQSSPNDIETKRAEAVDESSSDDDVDIEAFPGISEVSTIIRMDKLTVVSH